MRKGRDRGDSAAGRSIATGRPRGVGQRRRSGLAVRRRRDVTRQHPLGIGEAVSVEPIAAARLPPPRRQEQEGKRHEHPDKVTPGGEWHEGAEEATHGTTTPAKDRPQRPWPTSGHHRPHPGSTVDRAPGSVNECVAGDVCHFTAVSFPAPSASQIALDWGSATRIFPERMARPTGPFKGSPVIHLVTAPSGVTFQIARA